MSSPRADARALAALLWPHLRPRLAPLAGALALGLLIAGLAALQPLLTRLAIDGGLIAARYDRLVLACAGMLALAAAGLGLGALHRIVYVRAAGRVLFSLRGAAYAHLLRVSPRRLAAWPVGDLVSRLDGDVAELQRFGTDAVAGFVNAGLALATTAAVMLSLSWRLTLLVAALLPLQLAIRHYARPRLESSTRRLRAQAGELGAFLVETLGAVRDVQGAGAARLEERRLAALSEDYLGRALEQQLVGYGTGAAASLAGHLATAGVFLLGGRYVLGGELTVGTLVAFAALYARGAGSSGSLLGLYTGYQRARVSLERVAALGALPVVEERPDAVPLPVAAPGALAFEGVRVELPGGRPVIDGLDLAITAGSKVLLRGASGAGKTTLIDLLRRFVEPDAGRVLLDGRPLAEYALEDLRRRIAVVEHAPVLVRGTILDNLRYGLPEVNEAAVLEAAVLAGVDAFVRELPQGYRTPVGTGGATLS
ncbi:MAG: ABC transporter ATP-binding protein, partial [Proteobacteria bacterium]|nr:ABC transporter ATP-binding protein [Pseudomonadota bacterium]